MSERYSRLFSLSENLYAVGSPVVIAAGTLLKDNQTGRIVAQLKLRSISSKTIIGAKIRLCLFDNAGKVIGDPVDFDYLDLSAARDTEFGQKTPVPVPESKARSYQVTVQEVVFADKTTWTASDSAWEPLPAQKTLDAVLVNAELIKQYKIAVGSNFSYYPLEEKDLWYCACGALNHEGESCHICRRTLFELQTIDLKQLAKDKDARLAREAAAAEAKAAAEKAAAEAAKKKTAKILKTTIPAVCALIAVALLATKVIIPNVKYNHAISLMEVGQYEEAIAAFEAMDGFNDSLTHIVNCKIAILDTEYNSAVAMIEAGKYKEAIAQFESLGNYKDAEKRIQDTQYKWVEDLLSNKNWEEAISKLKSMGNNPVIKKRIQEAQYRQAKHLMQEEDYEAALPIFESLGNYKDAATYVQELVQLTANILRSNEIPWWTLNESKRAGYKIHSYTIQELSNGYIRCIIDCTVPIRTRVSAFNPPNGSNFMLDSKATTIGRNTVTFEIKIDTLKKDPIISHSFYDTGDGQSAFFIGPEDSALCSFLKDCQ